MFDKIIFDIMHIYDQVINILTREAIKCGDI